MKMIAGILAGSAALIAATWALSAIAQEIKPGRWQYSTAITGAGMPKIPAEQLAKMPPDVRARIQGMMHGDGMSYSGCITADRPVPKSPRNQKCTMSQMSREGATVTWSATCAMSDGRVTTADAAATYTGDTMAMDMTIHTRGRDGKPMTMHQHTTGRYVGPCE